MQDHETSKSNLGNRSTPRNMVWMLGAICFASAAYALSAHATPIAASAVVRDNANTERSAGNLGGQSGDPVSNSGTRSVRVAAASAAGATGTGARAVDNGSCSKSGKWGAVKAQTCINSPGRGLVASNANVNLDKSCDSCEARFVLQLKKDVPRAIDPVVAEVIYPYRAGRLAIESRRVEKGKYYTFWRLEMMVDKDWIRVATQESPHVDIP
jgi:hypothetical protein